MSIGGGKLLGAKVGVGAPCSRSIWCSESEHCEWARGGDLCVAIVGFICDSSGYIKFK